MKSELQRKPTRANRGGAWWDDVRFARARFFRDLVIVCRDRRLGVRLVRKAP